MTDYTLGLNTPQKEAVLHSEGPLLIVAGAGAGKTKTLTHRILRLIDSGIEPRKILAVTFTNKAAQEMRERVRALLGGSTSKFSGEPFIGTFHSLGVHILRENHVVLGIPRHFTILDKNDSLSLVKDAVKAKNLDPKQFDPKRIRDAISRQKGEGVTAEKFREQTGESASDFFRRMAAEVWLDYEKRLAKEGAFDFDDLLLKTLGLLRKETAVREKYQDLWRYIHIDEYQDTNTVQYELTRILAEKYTNICVVGDTDQCFPKGTLVSTKDGKKSIEDIHINDMVISAAGDGNTCISKVEMVRKKMYSGELLEITAENGKVLQVTPEHIFFGRFSLDSTIHYVYLMYKKNKGFRVGIVQGNRRTGYKSKEIQVGFLVRCNQEKADRMWVIRVCKTRSEAIYWEYFYSCTYSIPTVVFLAAGRKISLTQTDIDTLFQSIDTKKNSERLFSDTGLSFEYPHYTPQGTTAGNTENKRLNVRLVMFSDKRKNLLHPFGSSRVSINTTDGALKEKLELSGIKTRKGKKDDWRMEVLRLDYGEAEKFAQKLIGVDKDLILNRYALLTGGARFAFLPASSLRETMELPFLQDGKIITDTIISVTKKWYEGEVYDLNIENTHNYVVNSIAVHNCVYGWRGANIKNMLRFEKDYSGAQTILLEENYRSTQNILSAANEVIKKNTMRVEKNLFTQKGEGEKIVVYEAYDETGEAYFIAGKIKELISGGIPPGEIAVLFRANYQSRALEEAMLSSDIPYQVLGVKFFDRKEVKDTLSFLRASLNRDSMLELKRIINVPPRGIGETTLKKIIAGQKDALPAAMKKKVADFEALLSRIRECAQSKKPTETIKFIIKETGMEHGFSLGGEEELERLENIRELVTLAAKYDDLPQEEGIAHLLEDAALASDQDSMMHSQDSQKAGSVRLMTVHASKGLEFQAVFVTGLEDGLFPHRQFGAASASREHDEEERRLFYVAITRAKERLFLTFASIRTIFGSRQVNIPSEFLSDINEDLIKKEAQSGNTGGKVIYL
jgi:DNA helicase-2/ATP-dependent DNA helicase PcrA